MDGVLRNTNKEMLSKWSHQHIFAHFLVLNWPKRLLFSNKRNGVKIGQHAFALNQGDTPLSVEDQLKRNDTKAKEYSKAISQYMKEGFAEEVTSDDHCKNGQKVRYLPHHAVYREDESTTKTRIVFDASTSEGDKVSLNDSILQGPALQPNLVSVLIRFRMHHVALVANVKKMLLQIKIADEDQDPHRHVWREIQTDKEPKVFRFKIVTFGVNCSLFLAIATV